MTAPRPSDPRVRYLKARFQPFFQPAFLVSVTIFSALIAAIVGYWQHPEWLEGEADSELNIALDPNDTETQNRIANSGLSIEELEELSAGAEQVNLAQLLEEFDQPTLIPNSSEEQKNNQKSVGERIQEETAKAEIPTAEQFLPRVSKKKTRSENPFVTDLPNGLTPQPTQNPLLNPGSSQNTSNPFATSNSFLSPTASSPESPINPLQQALDRLETESSETVEAATENPSPGQKSQDSLIPSTTVTETRNFGFPGFTPIPNATPIPPITPTSSPNAYTFLTQTQGVEVVPTPAPSLSSSPQTIPLPASNLPNSFIQSPTQPSSVQNPGNQNLYNQNSLNNPNTFGQSQTTPLNQPQSPFSTPNSTPGRYIGGGQINTFSNP